MDNTIINPFESDINPWSKSISKKAEEFKEMLKSADTPQAKEFFEIYQLQYGELYAKKRVVEDIKNDKKYRAERIKIVKRLEKLNSLIGDIN